MGGKANLQLLKGTRTNQYSLDQTRGTRHDGESEYEQGSGVGKKEFVPRSPQPTKGQGMERIQITNTGAFLSSTLLGGGRANYSAKLKVDFACPPGSKWTKPKLSKWDFEFQADAKLLGSDYADKLALLAVPIAANIAEALGSAWTSYKGQYKNKYQLGSEAFNPSKDLAAQLYTGITAATAAASKSPKTLELLGKDSTKFKGAIGLGFLFRGGQEVKLDEQVRDGKPNLEPFKCDLSLQKTSYLGLTVHDSEVKFETTRQLARVIWRKGKKINIELYPLEWEKEYNKDAANPNTWSNLQRKDIKNSNLEGDLNPD